MRLYIVFLIIIYTLSIVIIEVKCRKSLAQQISKVLNVESFENIQTYWNVSEHFAVPTSQGWLHCNNCSWVDGHIILSHENHSVLTSWSLWSEFFHRFQNDRYFLHKSTTSKPLKFHYIDRPVFIIPMITLHVGHILIDVLEQLYQAHMHYYGRIRKDAIIVLDVASEFERPVLKEKIELQVNTGDDVGSLLRLFTDSPVQSIDFLAELTELGAVVFQDLHVGADISNSFFNLGQAIQPCIFSLKHGNQEIAKLSKRYKAFSHYLRSMAPQQHFSESAGRAPNIFIVQRHKNRVILNANELAIISNTAGYITETGYLEDLSFSVQRRLFAHTDVLVSMAGTALHNILFMCPGTAVVIFMQPHWCEFAWMYANQAVLLNIRPFVYCAPSTPLVLSNDAHDSSSISTATAAFKHFQWSRQFWLQGPRQSKSDNITVSGSVFASLLQQAVARVIREKNNGAEWDQSSKGTGWQMGVEPMMCPGQHSPRLPSASSVSATGPPSSTVQSVQTSRKLRRTVDVYISAITASFLSPEEGWKLAISGEIGAKQGSIREILRTMPRLAICMESADMPPWCHPLNAFNYYTDLFLYMGLPQQGLHIWAQSSSTGGKLRGSDVYIVLDCRLPEAGFALHRNVVNRMVIYDMNIGEDCLLVNNSNSSSSEQHGQSQVLFYSTQKYGRSQWNCRRLRSVRFEYFMRSRLSLQRHTTDFCQIQELSGQNCIEFIGVLYQHLYRILYQESLQLLTVQYSPTIKNPFFFLHIEKTAGSTLREYINVSAEERDLSAFIPCHTEHCAVFAAPLHRPVSEARESSAATLSSVQGEASSAEDDSAEPTVLIDLRLVQPNARDNSNLTVLAGHFDFYTPYNALPQCSPVLLTPNPRARWTTHILYTGDPAEPDRIPLPTLPSTPHCKVACFTVGRHPVDRAISYYYQRFYQRSVKTHNSTTTTSSDSISSEAKVNRPLNERLINELEVKELEQIALSAREGMDSHFYPGTQVFIDEGMSDAVCAAVLGLKFTTGRASGQAFFLPPEIPLSLYPTARRNLQQCVVGLQERWTDTLKVLDHWFPWIDFSKDPALRKMSLYTGLETRHTLRTELYDLLVALNPCDMMLYQEMQRLFALQLEVLEQDFYA